MKKTIFIIIIVMLLASLVAVWQIGLFTESDELSLEPITLLNNTNLTNGFSAVMSFSSSNSSNGTSNIILLSEDIVINEEPKTQPYPGTGNYWHGHSPSGGSSGGGSSNNDDTSFSIEIPEDIIPVTNSTNETQIPDENQTGDYPEDPYCNFSEDYCEDEEAPDYEEDPQTEVPEFSTIAAGVVLVSAGFYISRKRQQKTN